jgi:hypothetical protein
MDNAQSENSVLVRLFRNPLVVGLAILGTIAGAFQVAGVTSMLLAKVMLAAGIWIFITVEVGCSKWIKRTRRHFSSVLLTACCLSGIGALKLATTIADVKRQDAQRSINLNNEPPSPTPAKPIRQTIVPTIVGTCGPSKSGSACEMDCSVKSTGTTATRDVSVGFVYQLPVETHVAAPPDMRIALEKSDSFPVLPPPDPKVAEEFRVFVVRIPLLPPRASLPFSLWTGNEDNRKACQQLQRIQQERREIVKAGFNAAVAQKIFRAAQLPNVDNLLDGMEKKSILFHPQSVMSEYGRTPVEFISRQEKAAMDHAQVWGVIVKRLPEIFKGRQSCMLPVFTIEQTGGKSATVAHVTPWVPQFGGPFHRDASKMPNPDGKTAGYSYGFFPEPPSKYICVSQQEAENSWISVK